MTLGEKVAFYLGAVVGSTVGVGTAPWTRGLAIQAVYYLRGIVWPF